MLSWSLRGRPKRKKRERSKPVERIVKLPLWFTTSATGSGSQPPGRGGMLRAEERTELISRLSGAGQVLSCSMFSPGEAEMTGAHGDLEAGKNQIQQKAEFHPISCHEQELARALTQRPPPRQCKMLCEGFQTNLPIASQTVAKRPVSHKCHYRGQANVMAVWKFERELVREAGEVGIFKGKPFYQCPRSD